MSYKFREIEAKWQKYWAKHHTFKAENSSEKEKFYVLDMFPYPSGAGLHVGHPLGYIASDIYARYKRHKGYNVLHPQGYDSFGLPAEQYAIQTGQHPAITTEENIKTYRRQLDQLGFSFDWSREVRTSDPTYYKWTQWVFIQLFNSWFNRDSNKAEPIADLINIFENDGNTKVNAVCDDDTPVFSAEDWKSFTSNEQQQQLLKYRLLHRNHNYSIMKHVILLCLAFVCLSSCNDDDENRTIIPNANDIVGTWNLIEVYADPGDGSGDFVPIESDKRIEFMADGSMSSNANLCFIFSDVGETSIGTYSEEDSSFDISDCDNEPATANYEIIDSHLIVYYPCIEACDEKYEKI